MDGKERAVETLLNKYAINQVAYVVEDLEEAARAHSALFGSGPFFHFEPITMENVMYRGQKAPLTTKCAYGAFGDLQIELIQDMSDGPSVYQDKGYGFHHFSIWVDDYEATLEEFKQLGFEPAMFMESNEGLRVCYVDCLDAWGHFVEFHRPLPDLVDMCKALAKDWDGSDPYRKFSM